LKFALIYVKIRLLKNKEDKKMSKNKAFAFGMGLLAGVVGGIIAGVLYAPKPGEESRRELKEAAEKLYNEHSPAI
jgi:gas vesicle protein